MTRNQHVVSATYQTTAHQFGAKLREMRRGSRRKRQNRQISDEFFNSTSIFYPLGRALDTKE